MGSSPKSPNNEFVESGRKSQSEYREKILVDSVKGKELHMHKYKKHHRLCPDSMINSIEFFLFTAVFLQPFALSCFSFFPRLSFESLFVLYTMVFAPFFPSTCESGVQSFFVHLTIGSHNIKSIKNVQFNYQIFKICSNVYFIE